MLVHALIASAMGLGDLSPNPLKGGNILIYKKCKDIVILIVTSIVQYVSPLTEYLSDIPVIAFVRFPKSNN
jgi:hypothetical protein